MAYVRTPFIALCALTCLLPDVALARREPGPADMPAAAAQPVAPAAPTVDTAPMATAPASATATPVAAAPVAAAPVAAPVAAAPVVPASMHVMSAPVPVYVPQEKRARGLILGGATLLTTAYLYTSVLGAIAIDKGRKGRADTYGVHHRDDERVAFGRRLMIPVVGPFLALGHTDSALKRWGASFAGVAQVAGVVLVVAGVVAKSRINRARRFGWTAGASHGGGTVTIHGRF